MPLKVLCCCTYRTSSGRRWNERDWGACFFIKAIKGKHFNGSSHVPIPGEDAEPVHSTTADRAPQWFGTIARRRLRWERIGAVALVPIPNSSCATEADEPRTIQLARALAIQLGDQAEVSDILRWREAMPSAHQAGGTRDPQRLYRRLRLIGPIPRDRRIVLIDDVLTSGGHLQAAMAFLVDNGGTVAFAICAGRADNEFIGDDAFAVRVETLADFVNDPLWTEVETDDEIF